MRLKRKTHWCWKLLLKCIYQFIYKIIINNFNIELKKEFEDEFANISLKIKIQYFKTTYFTLIRKYLDSVSEVW